MKSGPWEPGSGQWCSLTLSSVHTKEKVEKKEEKQRPKESPGPGGEERLHAASWQQGHNSGAISAPPRPPFLKKTQASPPRAKGHPGLSAWLFRTSVYPSESPRVVPSKRNP